jgi:hypothetical protein
MIIATQIRSTVKYITKVLISTIKPKKRKKEKRRQHINKTAYFSCIMTNRSKTQKNTQQYIYKPNKINSIAWKKNKK